MVSNITFWITTVVLLVIIAILIIKVFFSTFLYYAKIDTSMVIIKNLKIPVNGIEINAKLIYPKFVLNGMNKPKEKLPLIFINHGWSNSIKWMFHWAIALSLSGPYTTLVYDCRGHGKSGGKKRIDSRIFDDIPKIFDFGSNLENTDSNKMGFIGMSMGGEIGLTRAYMDKRIKAIVSMSSPSDIIKSFNRKKKSLLIALNFIGIRLTGLRWKKLSEEGNKDISPAYVLKKDVPELNNRVFLVHAENDHLVPFDNFEHNREILNLPDDRVLIVKKGDHGLIHQEFTVLADVIRFFKEKL